MGRGILGLYLGMGYSRAMRRVILGFGARGILGLYFGMGYSRAKGIQGL